MDHLAPGVHAGVGAPRAHELDGVPTTTPMASASAPGHRALPGLDCEAPEPGAVIGDDERRRVVEGGGRAAGARRRRDAGLVVPTGRVGRTDGP